MARATINDVAAAAGVSIKTVSRVLNDERYVGAATRARVEAAVAALNFRPSLAARALAGGRARQIALICDNPSPYYVHQMQLGVRDRCAGAGVRMIAHPYDRAGGRVLAEIEELVATTPIDGLVLTPPVSDDDAVLDWLLARGVPFARVSPGTRRDLAPSVFIDNEGAAKTLVLRLLAMGHARIGFIGGDPAFAASARRRDGYLAALAERGITRDETLMADADFDFAAAGEAAEAMLSLPEPPTAIFAANDEMAAGVLYMAAAKGVAVPGRLSVAGFGDDAIARMVPPGIATVSQPTRDLGWQAVDLLLGGDSPRHRELPVAIRMRGSAGPRQI